MRLFVFTATLFFSSFFAMGSPISDMESQLLSDAELEIAYRVESLPRDIMAVLYAAARTEEIVDYGEHYNKTDAINPKYPMVQHQFTMYSDNTAAVLFRQGGFVSNQTLVVMDRNEPKRACAYRIVKNADTKYAILELLRQKKKYMHEYIFDFCRLIKVGS